MKSRASGTPTALQLDITKITPERLRQLRQLCHPDRHGNSPLSVAVQTWLGEVGKELDSRAKKPVR